MADEFNLYGNTFQGPTAIGPGAQSTNSGSIRISGGVTSDKSFESLVQALIKCGVPAAEMPSLRAAIAADQPGVDSSGKKMVGSAARKWIDAAVTKIAGTASQIEIGIIGGMLATAIEKFYNFP